MGRLQYGAEFHEVISGAASQNLSTRRTKNVNEL
jgi:hypothetical protein